ncbi:MazG nucleotide pyrophosphohydrolase domain-containing protein [Microbacterium excoecariae]|uniref:MazG nucleotide pyrophosphohydrolase domain-containing protein n=1 Tax=Microbacterium excoecariae TaxID=2715210 RepID=UPI001408C158|nr:MazG nucleotide pyrophosphohydrolase domain-containing protein [Microbacterium excoecariae]NHI17357.1 nucleoside triphosphate pyrophosphohydrolase [Microbacterium excoecariae]
MASSDTPELLRAVDVMRRVHDTCVWSRQMTHDALAPYATEEAAEVVDAIERGDRAGLREELGDLLWQVLFHAEVAAADEADPFTLEDVAGTMADKMIRRHPHVFAGEEAETPERVLELWNAAKAAEKPAGASALDGVSPAMPALALAQKVLGRAERAGVGLEFREEIAASEAIEADSGEVLLPTSEEELGEVLAGLAALARARGWDAERALRGRVRALADEVRRAEVEE